MYIYYLSMHITTKAVSSIPTRVGLHSIQLYFRWKFYYSEIS